MDKEENEKDSRRQKFLRVIWDITIGIAAATIYDILKAVVFYIVG